MHADMGCRPDDLIFMDHENGGFRFRVPRAGSDLLIQSQRAAGIYAVIPGPDL